MGWVGLRAACSLSLNLTQESGSEKTPTGMTSMTEHSDFGYWVRPDGEVIAMTALQAHGLWIIENSIFDRSFAGQAEATEHAVLQGWIGLSLSPVGTSCGVRVRRDAVTKRAAAALRRIIAKIGFDKQEVYADVFVEAGQNPDHRTGLGKDIVTSIIEGAWDDVEHPNPVMGVDVLAERVNRLRFVGARRVMGAAAMGSGALPNLGGVRAEIAKIDPLRRQIRDAAYGWSGAGYDARKRGDTEFLLEALAAARSAILSSISAIDQAVQRAQAALCGAEDPYGVPLPPEWAPIPALLPDERPLSAMTRLAEAYADTLVAIKVTPNPWDLAPEPLRPILARVQREIGLLPIDVLGVRGHIQRLDSSVAKKGTNDIEVLHNLMLYYLCHECGRSSAIPVTRNRIDKVLSELRDALGGIGEALDPPTAPNM